MATGSEGARAAAARVRAALAALARWGRRGADYFPLTPLGLMLGLGAAAALQYLAYAQLDLVWLVVGFAALGLLGLSVVAVAIGALWMKLATRARARSEVARRTTETGAALPTGFEAPSLWFLPLVQITWTWEAPERARVSIASRRRRLREEVTLGERGQVRGVRRRIEVGDAFGLARLAIRQHDPVELTVLPHTGKLGEAPVLVSLSGGDDRPHPMGVEDGDRVELRRYVPGDPARFIHWKVFGRTRRLMVRMPERALSPARRTVAYQVAGHDDDASAAAARVAAETGSFGADFRFGADGAPRETARIDEAVEMIVRSAQHREVGGRALEGFVRRVEQTGPASLIVFAPARPGPWLAPVVATLRPRFARSRVVIATDGIDAQPPEPLWRRLLTLPRLRAGTPARELEQVIAALSATRAEVIVLDRRTGRRLGAKHRAAMRSLEAQEEAA
jgi:hypothetical protein